MSPLRPFLNSVINLIYPNRCAVCKVYTDPDRDNPVCEGCWGKVEKTPPPYCIRCGKGNPNYYFTMAWAPCHYNGVVRECIHIFKYRGKVSLARPLGQLMVDFAIGHLNDYTIDMIIPVPLHSSKKREREFNQAELLSKPVARTLNLPIVTNNLRRIRSTLPQSNLNSKEEKFTNIKGAFKLTHPSELKGKGVLLIDDLFTSGSTVNECSKTLLEAGAQNIMVLALARG